MVFIGCTDKIIIGSVHQIPDAFYLSGYIVHILFRSDPGLLGLLLDLLTMFVRSGLEVNIITFLTAESCDRICKYDLVGISNFPLLLMCISFFLNDLLVDTVGYFIL